MPQIIGRQETILQMFPPSDGTLGKLTIGIYEAIERSFHQQSMKNPTRAEVADRFKECMKWAKIMRGDLKFGIQRIVDSMDGVLLAKATGQQYEPSERACWLPQDGA